MNALELGIKIKPVNSKPKVIFLLGCDNYITPTDIPNDAFVVYIVIFYIKNRDLMVIKVLNMLILFYLQLTTCKDQEHMVKYLLIDFSEYIR